ncbi:hypothetical protein SELMODRAFT_413730 [Selaginella moellendorffii]|uniref:Uncharacterized protein n=1 Tax=Selaginella moellendorffii TaxID=88036 RepID=D8RQ15_SELML|nr:hypothetical protein SELMODRAFT_413730 [Selaginella moellendorffii]
MASIRLVVAFLCLLQAASVALSREELVYVRGSVECKTCSSSEEPTPLSDVTLRLSCDGDTYYQNSHYRGRYVFDVYARKKMKCRVSVLTSTLPYSCSRAKTSLHRDVEISAISGTTFVVKRFVFGPPACVTHSSKSSHHHPAHSHHHHGHHHWYHHPPPPHHHAPQSPPPPPPHHHHHHQHHQHHHRYRFDHPSKGFYPPSKGSHHHSPRSSSPGSHDQHPAPPGHRHGHGRGHQQHLAPPPSKVPAPSFQAPAPSPPSFQPRQLPPAPTATALPPPHGQVLSPPPEKPIVEANVWPPPGAKAPISSTFIRQVTAPPPQPEERVGTPTLSPPPVKSAETPASPPLPEQLLLSPPLPSAVLPPKSSEAALSPASDSTPPKDILLVPPEGSVSVVRPPSFIP